MPKIRITQYQVSTLRFNGAGDNYRFTLHLSGVAESGSANRVSISFGDNADPNELGQVRERAITVNLPAAHFREYYDILRHESPVFFTYNRGGRINDTTDQLSLAQLGTNQEPAGEGPVDGDS